MRQSREARFKRALRSAAVVENPPAFLSLLPMQWDHEPTPNPSREGNGQDADRRLFPSCEGSGVGRFMESLLSLLRMHWDHEPSPSPSQGRGTDRTRTDACSPPGRGWGRVGSWKGY